MTKYECDTCGEERSLDDKRIIKILNAEGKLARQEVETCVFCLTKGLVIGTNLTKVQKV